MRTQVEPCDELLPGEVSASTDPEDAGHWIAVYSELVDVLEGHPDRTDLRETIGRYQARLAFWRGRLSQLQANGPGYLAGSSEGVR